MNLKKKYTGDAGNYQTNVDRDDGKAPKPAWDRTWTTDDLDLPELPELIPVQVGLDCGQVNDSSAVSVAEPELRAGVTHHGIRRLERLQLGTSYPAVADRVEEIMTNLGRMSSKLIATGKPGLDPLLVVDAGGVGRGVADLLEERGLEPVRVTFTGGDGMRQKENGEWTIAKGTLVSSLLILIQAGRLHLPKSVEDEQAMIEELRAFRVDTTKSGNKTYGAKTGSHDDLLMSLALATLPGLRPKPPEAHFAISLVKGW